MSEESGSSRPIQIKVPEPPTGLKSGFLTDYWKYEKELPTMSSLEMVGYYAARGFQNIIAQPLSSGITILTMAVSLFLLAGFLLIIRNVDRILSISGSSLQVTAYLKDPVQEIQVREYAQALEQEPLVQKVNYISKSDALEFLKADLQNKKSLIEGFEAENPLPASLDVLVRQTETPTAAVEKVVSILRQNPAVEEVSYGSKWVGRAQSVLRVFRSFGGMTLLVTSAIVALLISNTIRLVMFARRDEIEIMQLVGASRNCITAPFVLGGLIQGVLGSIVGLLVLKFGFFVLSLQIGDASFFGVRLPELVYLPVSAIFGVLILGSVVGALGSYFALGRYLNV